MMEKLFFHSYCQIFEHEDLVLIALVNSDKSRMISIVSDTTIVRQLEMRTSKMSSKSGLLPDVLWEIISRDKNHDWRLQLVSVEKGQYKFVLFDTFMQQSYELNSNDAVLLSIISNQPILVGSQIMIRQSVPFKENSSKVPIPINTISNAMLEKVLSQAIENEEYEKASYIRDELERRKNSNSSQSGQTL